MWVPSASQILFWRSQKSLILRNHGLLTCGPTVAPAIFLMKNLEKSCQARLAAMASGGKVIQLSAPSNRIKVW
jgi:ribulose-5-phosphate 4-epimerase/fuculose-1-phosphate aldolase